MGVIAPVRYIDLATWVGKEELSLEEKLYLDVAGDDLILAEDDFFHIKKTTEIKLAANLGLGSASWFQWDPSDLLTRVQEKLVHDILERKIPQMADALEPLVLDFGPHLGVVDLENLCQDLSRIQKLKLSEINRQGLIYFVIVARNAQALNQQVLAGGYEGISESLETDLDAVIEALLSGKIQVDGENATQDLPSDAAASFTVHDGSLFIHFRPKFIHLESPDIALHEMIHAAQYLMGRFDMALHTDRLPREREAYQTQWLFNLYFFGEEVLRADIDASLTRHATEVEVNSRKKNGNVKRAFEILQSKNTVYTRYNTVNIMVDYEAFQLATVPHTRDTAAEWTLSVVHRDSTLAQREKDLDQSIIMGENLTFLRLVSGKFFTGIQSFYERFTNDSRYLKLPSVAEKEMFLKRSFAKLLKTLEMEIQQDVSKGEAEKDFYGKMIDIYALAIFGDTAGAIEKLQTLTEKMKTESVL